MHAILGGSPKIFFEFPTHTHACWEILFCLKGTGTATIDGQDYPFQEGTIFCIPPNIPHSKRAPEGYADHSIFTADFMPPDPRAVPVYQDDADHTFQNLLHAAYRVQLRGEANAAKIVDSIAGVLYQLMETWSAAITNHSDAVNSFQSLLMDNISNCAFDITEAIEQTGYSASYFRKRFKTVTGLSPTAYFNRMRMEFAKTLLRQSSGQFSIKDIALSAGFPDPYYFSRVFKEYTGCSPSAYLTAGFDRSLIQGMPEYRNSVSEHHTSDDDVNKA